MVFSGPALSDCTCEYCGKTIFRGEYCIKEGLFKGKYYHNECYGHVKSGEPPERVMKYCISCGARIVPDAKFCSKCGAQQ